MVIQCFLISYRVYCGFLALSELAGSSPLMCIQCCCVDTACAKNVVSGQWYNFDDSSVSSIAEEAVVVSTASFIDLFLCTDFPVLCIIFDTIQYDEIFFVIFA